jgi:hypothetical protein
MMLLSFYIGMLMMLLFFFQRDVVNHWHVVDDRGRPLPAAPLHESARPVRETEHQPHERHERLARVAVVHAATVAVHVALHVELILLVQSTHYHRW